MLVLTRRVGERIRLGVGRDAVWVTVCAAQAGGKVQLGFESAHGDHVRIDREEIAVERDAGVRR